MVSFRVHFLSLASFLATQIFQTAGIIDVDVESPFNNREVVITYLAKLNVSGIFRSVYRIDLDNLDIRDVLANSYVLRLVPDHPNWAELSMPFCCYTRRNEVEAAKLLEVEKDEGHSIQNIQDVMDEARNSIHGKTKKLLLRFDEDVVLTNECFSPGTMNNVVDFAMLPVETSFVFTATKTYGITTTCLSWMVATVEEKQRVVATPRVATATDKLAARLARMSTE